MKRRAPAAKRMSNKRFRIASTDCKAPLRLYTSGEELPIYKELRGIQIGFPLLKILNSNHKHYGHTYTLGLNVLPDKFKPQGFGQSGGFYLTWEPEQWIPVGQELGIVTLPDDARVWVMPTCIKVDRLILQTWEPIGSSSLVDWKKAIDACPRSFMQIAKTHQTLEQCRWTLHALPSMLEHVSLELWQTHKSEMTTLVEDILLQGTGAAAFAFVPEAWQTETMSFLAVRNDPMMLKHVLPKNQTYRVINRALQGNVNALKFVASPTRKTLKWAVKHDGNALRWIPRDKQDLELTNIAIKSNPDAIRFAYFTTVRMWQYSLSLVPSMVRNLHEYLAMSENLEEYYRFAIQSNPTVISLVPFPSDALRKFASELVRTSVSK